MRVPCLICGGVLDSFHVFPRKALFNKPLKAPQPDAVADMGLGYCSTCRHISSRLEMAITPEELKEKIYLELYNNFVPTGLSPLQKQYTDFVARWLLGVLPPSSRVLEIGCHDGYLLGQLQAAGHRCEGVEPSPFAEVAQDTYGIPVRKEFFRSDQFRPGEFDLVIIRHVVEHVDAPVEFLTDAARVLRDGGLMYVEVPNSYGSVEHAFFPEFHVDHVSYFTLPSALRLFALAGLGEIVHAEAAWGYMKFPFLNVLGRKVRRPSAEDAPGSYFFDFRIEWMLERFVEKYRAYRDNLGSVAAGRTLAVWGSGSIGTQYAIDAGWVPEDVTYVDLNPANQNLVLSVTGHPVRAPEAIATSGVDTVLIASGWESDVRVQVQPFLTPQVTEVLGYSDLLGSEAR